MDFQDAFQALGDNTGQQGMAPSDTETLQHNPCALSDHAPTDQCLHLACRNAFCDMPSPDLLAMDLQHLYPPGHG